MKGDKFWGGRFEKKVNGAFFDFQKSISYDWPLAKYDIYHSLIHIKVLVKERIITSREAKKLEKELKRILRDLERGRFRPDSASEDIHTDIHNKIKKKLPYLAAKLHTLRSRNDQIVFDERLFLLDASGELLSQLKELEDSFKRKARTEIKSPFISYTHTQRAQVIYFSQYLLGWYEFFASDRKRLKEFRRNIKISLGAGSGSGVLLSPNYYFQALAELKIGGRNIKKLKNSLYNVSDRDFLVEFIFILALIQMHFSRLCEDLILYSTREFDYIELPEEFCTGSSIMPHKKNPDFLELVRGNTALIYGNLNAIFVLLKALPLSYNRDLQLDKKILFPSWEIVKEELALLPRFIEKLRLRRERVAEALSRDQSLYATELAELLVRKGVPFSQAHKIVGRLIRYSEKHQQCLEDIPASILKKFHPYLQKEKIKKILNPTYVLKQRHF